MINLSIIILNYQTPEITIDCLNNIKNSDFDKKELEVILIDNNSLDDSIVLFKKHIKENQQLNIKLIANQNNLGFSIANNQGIRQARGKYILLLNSDVMLEKNTLIKQIKFMEQNKDYAVSTCKLLLANKKIDPACHRGFPIPWASLTYFLKLEALFPKSKLFGQYHQGWTNYSQIHEIDALSGAFFMARSEIFNKVGLFDEGFFMYGEDLDLCLRIKEMGFKIAFFPETQAIHLKGLSGRRQDKNNQSYKNSQYYFWQAMKIFYQKHYQKKYSKILNWFILKVINFKINKYDI